ncbi:hypothetical protein RSPO_m00027 (plasmid) [Ralstonia solanacearum Po82]|uniref:Uncharacterized protein n=1 Tax=Ralstonia solanacearum (strain Po82) TaxID=1031711 RepID=F6G7Z2_RALS8|nr:hypothetical protein RSPO_m00027 [Ralstonia solanacearum Po82]
MACPVSACCRARSACLAARSAAGSIARFGTAGDWMKGEVNGSTTDEKRRAGIMNLRMRHSLPPRACVERVRRMPDFRQRTSRSDEDTAALPGRQVSGRENPGGGLA